MKARIKWVEQVSFLGETESGHAVLMDGPPEGGGRNLGPRPMELVLIGTGGCATYDVIHILKKSRQQVSDCVVEIQAERAAEDPKIFTKIHFHFIVSGKDLKTRTSGARDQAVSGKILLCIHHAGKSSGYHPRF